MPKREDGLPAKVAQQLLQRIIAKEFPPGTVLPSEREMQELYAVSRPVAREAIKLLAARGVIMVHPRQGATVSLDLTGAASDALLLAFDRESVMQVDLLDARMLLEPHIVLLAAQHATPLHLRRLQQFRETLCSMLAADNQQLEHHRFEDWGFSDAQFHVLLAEASQNPAFKILIEMIVAILWKQRQKPIPMTAEHVRNATQQHLAIADAIIAHDGAVARQRMIEHLEYTRVHIMSAQNTLQTLIQVEFD